MFRDPEPASFVASASRTVAVWLAVTGVAAGAAALSWPGAAVALRALTGAAEWRRVDSAITDLSSLVLVAATAWGWAVATVTVVGLLRGRATASGGLTHRLVLAACGAALVASGGPAVASTDGSPAGLHGLPYPDRPSAVPTALAASTVDPPVGADPRPGTRTVLVEPGDSLWSIAVRTAPRPESVEAHWRAIISANPGLLDPDLVLPGQHITVPGSAGAW